VKTVISCSWNRLQRTTLEKVTYGIWVYLGSLFVVAHHNPALWSFHLYPLTSQIEGLTDIARPPPWREDIPLTNRATMPRTRYDFTLFCFNLALVVVVVVVVVVHAVVVG
jgi:hypothetical protein